MWNPEKKMLIKHSYIPNSIFWTREDNSKLTQKSLPSSLDSDGEGQKKKKLTMLIKSKCIKYYISNVDR